VTDQHAATPDEGVPGESSAGGVRRARAAIGRAVRSTLPTRSSGSAGSGGSSGSGASGASGGDVHQVHEVRRGSRAVPEATVARLAVYLRVLSGLAEQGVVTVSSEELATAAGVNSANLRKDLSHLGSYGTRGVGYDVAVLVERIENTLGLTRRLAVALVGVGNLGHALAGYGGFTTRGFHIAALLDADPNRIGEKIAGLVVRHVDELPEVVSELDIAIGVIATPAHAAQAVCDQLVDCGVTSILNFAPTVLVVPDGVDVRKVDLAIELQILSFYQQRRDQAPAQAPTPAAALSGERRNGNGDGAAP
jgi:redox-sensing transcriptional repressor